MIQRQRLIDQLVLHEGSKRFPYVDPVGKITIGVGRNLTDKGLSHFEVLDLLENDIDEAIADLVGHFPWFAYLDDVRQRVLVDMRFNLGPSRFRSFRKMLTALELKDYVKASEEMADSLWARQVLFRADRLARMMATGQDDA